MGHTKTIRIHYQQHTLNEKTKITQLELILTHSLCYLLEILVEFEFDGRDFCKRINVGNRI